MLDMTFHLCWFDLRWQLHFDHVKVKASFTVQTLFLVLWCGWEIGRSQTNKYIIQCGATMKSQCNISLQMFPSLRKSIGLLRSLYSIAVLSTCFVPIYYPPIYVIQRVQAKWYELSLLLMHDRWCCRWVPGQGELLQQTLEQYQSHCVVDHWLAESEECFPPRDLYLRPRHLSTIREWSRFFSSSFCALHVCSNNPFCNRTARNTLIRIHSNVFVHRPSFPQFDWNEYIIQTSTRIGTVDGGRSPSKSRIRTIYERRDWLPGDKCCIIVPSANIHESYDHDSAFRPESRQKMQMNAIWYRYRTK